MRKIDREPLPTPIVAYLARKQGELGAGKEVLRTWKAARATQTMRKVTEVLQRMAGPRHRCMYCEDSRGSDIEHFWPKARYWQRTFVWENMLWICTACGRQKGDRFLLDAKGQPLLIDPTLDEPWDFLFYDPATGLVSSRYEKATSLPHPKRHLHDGPQCPSP